MEVRHRLHRHGCTLMSLFNASRVHRLFSSVEPHKGSDLSLHLRPARPHRCMEFLHSNGLSRDGNLLTLRRRCSGREDGYSSSEESAGGLETRNWIT